MNKDPLDTLFDKQNTPDIKTDARQQAIHAAMTAFKQQAQMNENKPQGFAGLLRLISDFYSSCRSTLMNSLQKRTLYTGLASVFVALLGTSLFTQIYTDNSQEVTITSTSTQHNHNTDLLAKAELSSQTTSLDTEAEIASSLAEPAAVQATPQRTQVTNKPVIGLKQTTGSQILIKEKVATAPVKKHSAALSDKRMLAPSLTLTESESDDIVVNYYQDKGRDRFEHKDINSIKRTTETPVSTFSIDVDTASYSFVRRQLNAGVLPQKDAVRIEEMVNYFDYQYALPESKTQPFKTNLMVQPAPWNENKQLIHIGIKGYDIAPAKQPRSNLVLLLDVSGSMNSPDKLPLVKQSMSMLLNKLQPEDTIGIVVYAGAAGKVLEPTPAKNKQTILDALNRLQAGGSTAGAQGIQLAYQLAENHFDKDAVNRIILATDGDFNVGINNREELKGFVERKREQGIFLSVLGFGQGNYHDHMMQTLAQNGNGVAAYIDSVSEAQKVLINQATSTLFTIARDVKIQIEFNPAQVEEYRLIGYETRHLNREDFNNDKVDAGDIGAGHSVTAIYEITLTGKSGSIDSLRYKQESRSLTSSNELAFLKVRYKLPKEDSSRLIEQAISAKQSASSKIMQQEANFANAVSAFAEILKGGKYMGSYSYEDIIDLAQANKGKDEFGYRTEFIQLVRKAQYAKKM